MVDIIAPLLKRHLISYLVTLVRNMGIVKGAKPEVVTPVETGIQRKGTEKGDRQIIPDNP
jgi:hypothetical protein